MRHEYSVSVIYENGERKTLFFFTEKEAVGFKRAMQQFGSRLNIVDVEEIAVLYPRNVYRPTTDLLDWLSVWAQ